MKKYFILAALALMAMACTKEQKETASSIELKTAEEVQIPTDGAIQEVSFTASVDWTASIDVTDWATITPSSGTAGDGKIKFNALSNTTEDPRTATLTIKAGTASKTVKFVQLQADAFYLVEDSAEIDCAAQTVTIKLMTNVDYEYETVEDWIEFTDTKGAVADEVEVYVAQNKGEARTGSIIFSGAGKQYEFTIKQGEFVPVFEADVEAVEFEVGGGSYVVNINANVEYEAYVMYGAEWLTFTQDGDAFTVTATANPGYGARTDYLVFVTEDIQVPVYDDAGEPTGETEPYYFYVTFSEDGNAYTCWRTEFYWDMYSYGGAFSAAYSGDYLLVANAYTQGLLAFNKADGTYATTIELPFVPTGVTNDDAGNVIVTTGGNYPINEETWALIPEDQVPLKVYVLKAGDVDVNNATCVITYYDGFYGYGLDNVRVSGDVLGEATLVVSSAGYGSSYAVAWQFTGGQPSASDNYTDYVTFYSAEDGTAPVWNSRNMINFPLGSKMADGIYGAGYTTMSDGNYGLCYNPGTWSKVDWSYTGLDLAQSWANAVVAMDIIEWQGVKILVADSMSYFAYADWDSDGEVDSYMPNYLYLVDITNPAAPAVIDAVEYYASPDNWQYGSNSDVVAQVEGDDLVVYIVNAAASHMQKMVFPKL